MKKKLCLLLVLVLTVFGFTNVNAQIVSMNFKETVEDEIDTFKNYPDFKEYVKKLESADLKDYAPSKDKVTVYIFRSTTCSHCLDAVAHFASIYKELGDKFDVVTYEVSSNSDNSAFMSEVGDALGANVSGVPLLVIGEKFFEGYGSSMDSQIETLINDLYQNDSYVDVVDAIAKGTYKKDDTEEKTNKYVSYVVLGIAAVIVIAIVVSRKNTEYYDDEDEKEVVEESEETEKDETDDSDEEVKEEAKKTTKKVAKSTTKKTTKKKTTKTTKKTSKK